MKQRTILIIDDPWLREAAREAGADGFVLKENLLELRSLLESASERLNQ